MKTKYIKIPSRLPGGIGGDQIIVFSEIIPHSTFKDLKPISAGFIKFQDGKCICYGESDGLGLASDPMDSDLANEQILNQF